MLFYLSITNPLKFRMGFKRWKSIQPKILPLWARVINTCVSVLNLQFFMESLSGMQIGWARNGAAAPSLCGVGCGLVGPMGCSIGGTWVCCIQGQEQLHCLFWHRARPKKCSEPKLALCRPILGAFGGMFALPEVLTHMISRDASGSTKDPEGLLTWAGFHFFELPAESFRYLGPASCQWRSWLIHLRADPTWTWAWVWFDTNARSPGGCAGEERDVWSQPGSSRAKMEEKLASLSLPDPCVWSCVPQSSPPQHLF